ncbi:FtsX-like permease family protein [uncultured Modestobacter sp.]|uniref:FtsX-like permease family protein n=1 Tax=uncultured Modestobacter sp. TaxID=380048 RepID=UPI00260E7F0E|nr:FtsX-like permease family protein [uncultured Modestobacter sp.]
MAGIAAAACVLALVTAAAPLFVASVGTGALHQATSERCAQDDQISLINPALNVYLPTPAADQPAEQVAAADPAVRRAFAEGGLPDPLLTTYTVVDTGRTSGSEPDSVGLFHSPGALSQVTVVDRVAGPGVYLSDRAAQRFGLAPGDTLPLATGEVRVAGVYQDLDTASYRTVLPEYWCHWRNLIVSSVSSRPPPFVLADAATVASRGTDIEAEWTSPIAIEELTLAEAHEVAAIGRSLFPDGSLAQEAAGSVLAGHGIRTQLDFDLAQTEEIKAAVTGSMSWIALAGALLGLTLVGGAVSFWAQRRHIELQLLRSRGVGPVWLAVKAIGELAAPAALGCSTGWALALVLVPLVGPSEMLDAGAWARGLLVAAAAWIACLLAVLLVATVLLSDRPATRQRPRTSIVAGVLGAVVPLLVAGWLTARAGDAQLVTEGAYRVEPALLLGPVVGSLALVWTAAALLAVALTACREVAGRWTVPPFLALHRALASRGPLLAALCGLALPLALAVYSAGFVASTETTIEQKAQTYTGAPVTLTLRVQLGQTPGVDGATPVSVANGRATGRGWDDETLQVLAGDPATFARYAFTGVASDSGEVPEALRDLATPAPDGPVPALLVAAGDRPPPAEVALRSTDLSVDVVHRFSTFPGLRHAHRPMLVVDLQAVQELDRLGGWQNELWTDQAHTSAVLQQLSDADVLTDEVAEPQQFLDATNLRAVGWSLDFLRLVAALVAVLSVAGLLLFLSARQERQETSYVMARRMGLSQRAFVQSLVFELGGMVAWAWAAGAGAGCVALLVATRTTDVNPGFQPPTVFDLPVPTLGAGAVVLATVGVAASCGVAWRARRADPAEVLRR